MKTGAIIVAAGRGQRAGGGIPKQYRDVGGKSVLERSVTIFGDHPSVDHLVVVINPDDLQRFEAVLPDCEHVMGGETRTLSVTAGLRHMAERKMDTVLIHDAARPFVSVRIIDDVIEALEENEGALPVISMTDALLTGADGYMVDSLDRSKIHGAQTPQGFRLNALLDAYSARTSDDLPDDATVLHQAGGRIKLVTGEPRNFKITRPEDFEKAERMLEAQYDFVSGQGYDVHRLEPADSMWLCGVEIKGSLGLVGHSDADAGLHALTDAILGAAGAGDIGQHFPPSDPQWSGQSSDKFLLYALELLENAGGQLVNADLTLICERPKIGPHRDAMRARIAELTALPLTRVNIKATTTEKLGFTGRGEGLAAQAIVSARMKHVSE